MSSAVRKLLNLRRCSALSRMKAWKLEADAVVLILFLIGWMNVLEGFLTGYPAEWNNSAKLPVSTSGIETVETVEQILPWLRVSKGLLK